MNSTVEDQTEVQYAHVPSRRRWSSPRNYIGALTGVGYGAIWPALVVLYIGGLASTYDKYFPHESFQDNLVGIVFKMPSEAIATAAVTILPEKLEDELGIPTYFLLCGATGHATQTAIRRIRHGRTKTKN